MKTFELCQAKSLDEALGLLDSNPETSKVIAGGVAIINLMKQGMYEPQVLVDLRDLSDLKGIEYTESGVSIGAMTSLTTVLKSVEVQKTVPYLQTVLGKTANRRIRNMCTLGGCLAHGDAASDPPAALLVLSTTLHIAGKNGVRQIPIENLFKDFYETDIRSNEIMTHITIEKQPDNAIYNYYKFTPRSAYDKPTLGVSVMLEMDSDNATCKNIKLAFCSAGPTPRRVYEVEQMLVGQRLTAKLLADAGKLASEVLEPFADVRGTKEYKLEMIQTLVPRTIEQTLSLRS